MKYMSTHSNRLLVFTLGLFLITTPVKAQEMSQAEKEKKYSNIVMPLVQAMCEGKGNSQSILDTLAEGLSIKLNRSSICACVTSKVSSSPKYNQMIASAVTSLDKGSITSSPDFEKLYLAANFACFTDEINSVFGWYEK
nr:hypothetical protein [uncultured Deefgea sp.]